MERIIRWATAAIVVTAIFVTLYAVMQQAERQGADDAPIRLASQVASQLQAGDTVVASSRDQVRLENSDEAFFVVYNGSGTAIAGTGMLGGHLAALPQGVVTAQGGSKGTVTWQPRPGLRFATDRVQVDGRVVIAGESLAPTESRIDRLGLLIVAAWAATIVVLAIAFAADQGLVSASRRRKTIPAT